MRPWVSCSGGCFPGLVHLELTPGHFPRFLVRPILRRCAALVLRILRASDVGMDLSTVCLRSRSGREPPSEKSESKDHELTSPNARTVWPQGCNRACRLGLRVGDGRGWWCPWLGRGSIRSGEGELNEEESFGPS